MRLVAHETRIDVLVSIAVLQHRGHMLPAFVRKSAVSDERLLQRKGQIRDLSDSAR
jgi:hypothetical protein